MYKSSIYIWSLLLLTHYAVQSAITASVCQLDVAKSTVVHSHTYELRNTQLPRRTQTTVIDSLVKKTPSKQLAR